MPSPAKKVFCNPVEKVTGHRKTVYMFGPVKRLCHDPACKTCHDGTATTERAGGEAYRIGRSYGTAVSSAHDDLTSRRLESHLAHYQQAGLLLPGRTHVSFSTILITKSSKNSTDFNCFF